MKFKLTKVDSLARKRLLCIIKKNYLFLLCTTLFGFTTENAFSQENVIIEKDRVVPVDEVFTIIQKQNIRKGRVACLTINSVGGGLGFANKDIDNILIGKTENTKPYNPIIKDSKNYTFSIWIDNPFFTVLTASKFSNQCTAQNKFKNFAWWSLISAFTNSLQQKFLELSASDILEIYLEQRPTIPMFHFKYRVT